MSSEVTKAQAAFRKACREFEANPTDNDTSVRLTWAKQRLTDAVHKDRTEGDHN